MSFFIILQVVIDSETTKNMLKTYMSSSINSALKELNPFPALQYELLEKLIADRKKGYFIENEYLTLYLNLMCKLGYKKEVFHINMLKFIYIYI